MSDVAPEWNRIRGSPFVNDVAIVAAAALVKDENISIRMNTSTNVRHEATLTALCSVAHDRRLRQRVQ